MPGDYDDDDDERTLLRVQSPSGSESDIESQSDVIRNSGDKRKRFIKRLLSRARELNGRRAELSEENRVRESAPPEWLLLLIGCLLGLGTGLCVALFNNAVHSIHTWSWAGTPHEGAAWLRQQRLADTWHRVLLVPLTGGVIVGVMHGLLEIFDQLKQSRTQSRQKFDILAALFPTVKAVQAAVTLGTGCSLGPEGPSVDIGISCANGLAEMIKNNKDSRIALTAAGAAAGISSGFNAPLAGCFFAFETVLRHNHSSLPIMTAMIILASVLSSTVSNAIFGGKQAFTVPTYELKSVAELPLYLILGMICGGVSVIFTHLVAWFTKWFEFIKEHFKMPAVINPALGGLGAGIIALRYPGILYWGFTNVDEILHTGKSASAPGIWLITQLVCAKVVATSLCKGSGLVGGLYAPSLMFGAAAGAVFGGLAAEVINAIIPGNEAVAHPQAYALVGMAATLASACSVPLTSVLLLFELTKDYRILLPLMGAVGLAYWEASVARLSKENESGTAHGSSHSSYHALTITEVDKPGQSLLPKARDAKEVEMNGGFSIVADDELLHHIKVSEAMSKHILKVSLTATIKEVMKSFMESNQNCALVVSEGDRLEGILTLGDLQRKIQTSEDNTCGDAAMLDVNTTLVSSVCTRRIHYRGNERRILVCYPDNDLMIAKEIMEARGVKQLPVVERNTVVNQKGHTLAGLLSYDSIVDYLRAARNKPAATFPKPRQYKENEISPSGH